MNLWLTSRYLCVFYPVCVCRRSGWSRCWPAAGGREPDPKSDPQTGSSSDGLDSPRSCCWAGRLYLCRRKAHRTPVQLLPFDVITVGNLLYTISWLGEQSVVRVDDFIRQDVKPFPNHTLALKHTHPTQLTTLIRMQQTMDSLFLQKVLTDRQRVRADYLPSRFSSSYYPNRLLTLSCSSGTDCRKALKELNNVTYFNIWEAFSHSAPRLWSSLLTDSIFIFKSQIKTHLLQSAFICSFLFHFVYSYSSGFYF